MNLAIDLKHIPGEKDPRWYELTDKRWTTKPIPLGMALRGFLPRILGGEPVYEAVVRTNHFGSRAMLMDYLIKQSLIAITRSEQKHAAAIEEILDSLSIRFLK